MRDLGIQLRISTVQIFWHLLSCPSFILTLRFWKD
jgi:hypothetical protein